MERTIPKTGEIYRHFKGKLYEIIVIARDSETLEEKVVYREVGGDNYVRPLSMFMSLVDREKYPDVAQKYRFELTQESVVRADDGDGCTVDHGMIMEFLDLDSIEDKIQYLYQKREHITEEFIGVVAQSLDFVENDGSLSDRYEAILKYLRTVAKFESGRLR